MSWTNNKIEIKNIFIPTEIWDTIVPSGMKYVLSYNQIKFLRVKYKNRFKFVMNFLLSLIWARVEFFIQSISA